MRAHGYEFFTRNVRPDSSLPASIVFSDSSLSHSDRVLTSIKVSVPFRVCPLAIVAVSPSHFLTGLTAKMRLNIEILLGVVLPDSTALPPQMVLLLLSDGQHLSLTNCEDMSTMGGCFHSCLSKSCARSRLRRTLSPRQPRQTEKNIAASRLPVPQSRLRLSPTSAPSTRGSHPGVDEP